MDDKFEWITMRVATKGGEVYCRDLGPHKGFSGTLYLTRAQENGGLLEVEMDLWLALDTVAAVEFVRKEWGES